ncbi:MAG: ATP-binding protein [Pseudomonadota bacterium]
MITTTLVLVVFLALVGWVLDRSYTNSIVTSAEEQLRLVIYSLMGTVVDTGGEQEGERLEFAPGLIEPRLMQPDSGLYATVMDDHGEDIWVSPSALTTGVAFPRRQSVPGLFQFHSVDGAVARFVLSYTVIWEDVDSDYQVMFSAATDQAPFRATIAQFRRSLGLGFGAAVLVFVLSQLLALRWGLMPLRTMASEVEELESGEREKLSDAYPLELTGLAANLDRFVLHEQRSRSRYRHALEDLAHSLKTPLAVVRNALLDSQPDKDLLSEQLQRMETTVTHQLSKATPSGPVVVGQAVELGQLAQRLTRAVRKAYAERDIQVEVATPNPVLVRGDERDFMEILGNLIENAFKYTRGSVRIETFVEGDRGVALICDDGPGIPENRRREVFSRGHRLDEIENGQGIGLAMVAELVELYQGDLAIDTAPAGGAAVRVALPLAG